MLKGVTVVWTSWRCSKCWYLLHVYLIQCADGGLGPSDLLTLMDELHEVRAKWENIGLGLGVTQGTLEAIKLQYRDPLDCLREVLKEWLKCVDPAPCWGSLIKILRRPAIGAIRIARGLEGKFDPKAEESPSGIVISKRVRKRPTLRIPLLNAIIFIY